MNNYYVYFHRKKYTNQIFYVGRGKGKRAWSDCRDKFWKACVKKHGLIVEIIHDNLTLKESCEFEIKYIKLYGRRGYEKNGILINRSLGGEFGPSGFKYSEESKLKMSESQKGKILSQEAKDKISKAKTGTKLSEESCKKISDAKKGHICFNDEWKQKISKSLKEGNHSQYYTDEVKQKISDAMKGKPSPKSEQCKENMKIAQRKKSKRVIQYDLQGNFIKEWLSKGEAADYLREKLNLKSNIQSQIKDCCYGRQKTSFGFIWRYKGDNLEFKPFDIIYQFDLNKKLINQFKSLKEIKNWIKTNRPGAAFDNIGSNIVKKSHQKIYKSGNNYYSINKEI